MAFVYVQSPAKANKVQNQVQVDLSFLRIQFLVVSLKSCNKTLFTFYLTFCDVCMVHVTAGKAFSA